LPVRLACRVHRACHHLRRNGTRPFPERPPCRATTGSSTHRALQGAEGDS
jgi:hypothetical protein